MKTQRYIKQLLCIAAWLPMAHLAAAQADTIPASGTWKKLTVTASDTVYLTGDTIRAEGTITIGGQDKTGVHVTIKNGNSGKNVTILDEVKNDKGRHTGLIFNVYPGNSLTIQGGEKDSVIFDGMAGFWWKTPSDKEDETENFGDTIAPNCNSYKYELKNGKEEKKCEGSMFATDGDLTLEYVKIHDYFTETTQDDHGDGKHTSAIRVDSKEENKDYTTKAKIGKTTLRHCTIENCQAPYGSAILAGQFTHSDPPSPEECEILLEDTHIKHCISTIADHWGGGVIRPSNYCNLKLKDCVMTENYSQGDGSCILMNAGGSGKETKEEDLPLLTIEDCTFDKNGAKRDGGAVIAETRMKFEGTNNKFTNNFCSRQGGAILIRPKIKGTFAATEGTYDISNVEISSNSADERGGGIAIDFPEDATANEGFRFEVDLEEGMNIHDNTAGKHGGGISFTNEIKNNDEKHYTFQLNLDGGMIKGNTATDSLGGGIYVNHSNISHNEKASGIEISENSAKVGGGGIYLTEGTMDISTVTIQGNKTTEGFGGGVYISNTNAQQRDSLILRSGGMISGNTAKDAGGGIAIAGYADVTVDGVNIQNNKSEHNGGGLYLKGDSAHNKRAEMIIESGIISSNIAEKEELSGDTGDTGYDKSESEIEGFGGGVYLDCFSYLKFNLGGEGGDGKEIGLYGNKAANGADDIFSVNDSSTVDLPNVKSMQLVGLGDETKDSLFWAEDYPTDDPNYEKGTHEGTEKENTRYRDKKAIVHEVDFAGPDTVFTDDTYICLTLGRHTMIDMIIEKTGLEDRDNAIFSIFKGDDKSKDLFMNVILTKDDISSGTRRKTISVRDGMWTVKETSWSWAYDTTPPEEPTRTLNSQSTLEERTFKFENKPKENIPKHAESVKTNTMPGN